MLERLQNKRNPMYYRKMAMKVFVVFMNVFILAYLFFIGCMLKDILLSIRPGMEPYNLLDKYLVLLPAVDMLLRFGTGETPAIRMRPFLLLPVPRKMVVGCYLLRGFASPFNLLWMAMLIPFSAVGVFPFYGVAGCIGYFFGWWLVFVLNGCFYQLVRTLVVRNALWLLLPAGVYFSLLLLVFIPDTRFMGYFFMYLGEGWMKGHIWSYLVPLAVLAGLFLLTQEVQTKAVWQETAEGRQRSPSTPHITADFSWFNRLGVAGEFMKMEMKSVLRNKTVRSQTTMLTVTTALFSLILSLSPDIYGDAGNAFWCYYCFFLMSTPLQHALGTEGNYMDGLMVHKDILPELLKGKYLFYCLLALIPLMLMVPAVVTGAVSAGRWFSYFLITVGFGLPVSMQTAVYTESTTPMNKKLTMTGTNNHMGFTIIWMLLVMTIPLGVQFLLAYFVSDTAAYMTLCLIGLAGFLTNGIWFKSLSRRIYQRRYKNLEGFRSSRQP